MRSLIYEFPRICLWVIFISAYAMCKTKRQLFWFVNNAKKKLVWLFQKFCAFLSASVFDAVTQCSWIKICGFADRNLLLVSSAVQNEDFRTMTSGWVQITRSTLESRRNIQVFIYMRWQHFCITLTRHFLHCLIRTLNVKSVCVSCYSRRMAVGVGINLCGWATNDTLTNSVSLDVAASFAWRTRASKYLLYRVCASRSCLLAVLIRALCRWFRCKFYCSRWILHIVKRWALRAIVGGGCANRSSREAKLVQLRVCVPYKVINASGSFS